MKNNFSIAQRLIILIILGTIFHIRVLAQTGGTGVYKFLDLPLNAKYTALGGRQITLPIKDIAVAGYNPALQQKLNTGNLSANYTGYLAGIKSGYVLYGITSTSKNIFSAGIQYLNYGEMQGADETGNKTGKFTASEYAINFIATRYIDTNFRIGINLKPVVSKLDVYSSYGIAADIGLYYEIKEKNISMAVVLRNFGSEIKPYTTDNYEPMPVDLQIGITQKPEHAPFRISVLIHHLHKFDLTYQAETNNKVNYTNSNSSDNKNPILNYSDKLLRHVNLGIEFLPSKKFGINLGYNHLRRKELFIENKKGSAGFSFGFDLNLKQFSFAYSRAVYHVSGSVNCISVSFNPVKN